MWCFEKNTPNSLQISRQMCPKDPENGTLSGPFSGQCSWLRLMQKKFFKMGHKIQNKKLLQIFPLTSIQRTYCEVFRSVQSWFLRERRRGEKEREGGRGRQRQQECETQGRKEREKDRERR